MMNEPQKPFTPPNSILIIGAGVFGISTCLTLLQSKLYDQTSINIVDAYAPSPASEDHPKSPNQHDPRETTASLDSSRIIRPDYPDPLYAKLADQATCLFRNGFTEDSDATERTYTQPGLVLISSGSDDSRGRIYLNKTSENTLRLARGAAAQGSGNSGLEPILLLTSNDVEQVLGCTKGSLPENTAGYMNPQAGWANASAAMSAIKKQVLSLGHSREATGKASFQFLGQTTISSLTFSPNKTHITGAILSTGAQIHADLTILAAGAWSASLLPSLLSPRLRASGQVLTYINLHSPAEIARYAGRPTVMDIDSGMFAIFPPKHYTLEEAPHRSQAHIKIARHAWGYSNPVPITDPLTLQAITCSLPPHDAESFFTIPPEGRTACRHFTNLILPELSHRAFDQERVCWYTDTPTCDFLIDYIPGLGGVLVATGGSGHGFKFLPVIGRKVVERLEGVREQGVERV